MASAQQGQLQFVVSLSGRIIVPGVEEKVARGLIEAHLDGVMDELLNLGAQDPDIELDLSTASVAFAVIVTAANPLGAASQASGLLRSAIHTAGGGTPDWPTPPHDAWAIQLLKVSSEVVTSGEGCEDEPLGRLVTA